MCQAIDAAPTRSVDIKRVEQGANGTAAQVVLGGILDSFVNNKLDIQPPPHGLGFHLNLGSNMPVFAGFDKRLHCHRTGKQK